MGCVYRVTCTKNNKVYIGKTKLSLEERQYQHYWCANNPIAVFHKAIAKYGAENFIWDVVCEHDDEMVLYEKEKEFIAKYNCMIPFGYNMTTGGDGNYNVVFSEDWRIKNRARADALGKEVYCLETDTVYSTIAEAGRQLGIPAVTVSCACHRPNKITRSLMHFCFNTEEEITNLINMKQQGLLEIKHSVSEETRLKYSLRMKGFKRSQESIEKQRATILSDPSRFGRIRSDETREKLSLSRKGKCVGKDNAGARKVLNVETGMVFDTIRLACAFFNLPKNASNNVCSCCRKKLKTAYGYHWEYAV